MSDIMNITRKLTLYANNSKTNDKVTIKRGCINVITLIISIYDNGGLLEIPSGIVPSIRMLRADHSEINSDVPCTVVGNTVHVLVNESMQKSEGEGYCEIILINDGKSFTSATFPLAIQQNVHNDTHITNTDDYQSFIESMILIEKALPIIEGAEATMNTINSTFNQIKVDSASAISNVNVVGTNVANAEALRATSESGRVSAESTRTTQENARKTSETSRGTAETNRVAAESGRVTVETARATAESSRATVEAARVTAETTRGTNETTRKNNETSRVSVEAVRVTSETARGTAEGVRVTNETARGTAETTRVSQENTRTTNETSRGTSETARSTAESTRATKEGERLSSETIRGTNEVARQSYYNAYKLCEAYVPATAYIIGNKVTYLGSTYQCKLACTGVLPTNTTNWLIIAVKGDTGLQGLKGDTGSTGAKGDAGTTGLQGLKGDQGIQGIQGIKGDKGDQGIQGIQGLKGTDGVGGDMFKNVYDPTGKAQDIFAYIDNHTSTDISESTTVFTEATVEADIVSGEKSKTIFGKILKSIKTFRTSIGNLSGLTTTLKTNLVGAVNEVKTSVLNSNAKNNFYNLNNMKNKRTLPLTFNSEVGTHYSTFSGEKACNGIMTIDGAANSGWAFDGDSLGINNIKFNMPIGVIIGDSIAEGHPALHGRLDSDGAGTYNANLLNSTGQISYHIEQHTKCKIFNHGYGGQRWDQIRTRWNRDVLAQTDAGLTPTSTLSKKPHFVIIICGINDVFFPRNYTDIITDAEYCINSAIANNIYPIVFNIGAHSSMDATKLALVKQYNTWLLEKSQNTPSMTLIDYFTYTNDINNDGKPISGLFTDGVHPTKMTYEDLSRKIINEAFISSRPPVVPRYINISTAINFNYTVASMARPMVMLIYLNDIPIKLVELINNPNQVIEIPQFEGFINTITLEPQMIDAPYEQSANALIYCFISEVYLSDENIYSNNLIKRFESVIKALPSVSGITKRYGAMPDSTAGQFTFVSTAGALNCIGAYVKDSTTTGYICTKGLAMLRTTTDVYDSDLLITSTSGLFARTINPTAGTVVAKVVKAGRAGKLVSLVNII